MSVKIAKNKKELAGNFIMEAHAPLLTERNIFDKTENFRDIKTGYEDGHELARKIVEEGHVIEPIHIGIVGKTLEEVKKMTPEEIMACGPRPERGFRRVDAVTRIMNREYDAMFPGASEKVEPYVPVIVNIRENMGEVIKARSDHSSSKDITMIDIGWMYYQYVTDPFINMTHAEIMYEMHPQLRDSLSAKMRADFDSKIAKIEEEFPQHLWQAKKTELCGNFYKGRRQDIDDAWCAKGGDAVRDRLIENYRKKQVGDKSAIVYPRGMKIPKDAFPFFEEKIDSLEINGDGTHLVNEDGDNVDFMTTNQLIDTFDAYYNKKRAERGSKVTDKMWNVKKLNEQIKIHEDNPILLMIFRTILGDVAQKPAWNLYVPMLQLLAERYEENPDNVDAFLNKANPK